MLRVWPFSFLLVFCILGTGVASGQLERGHHVHAMLQTYERCPSGRDRNRFVVVRFYRSSKDRYFYYHYDRGGFEVYAPGDTFHYDQNGMPSELKLSIAEDQLHFDETMMHPMGTGSFSASIQVQGQKCEITKCDVRVRLNVRTGCIVSCRPEHCEVRVGPASQ